MTLPDAAKCCPELNTVVVEQAALQNVAGVLRITCHAQHFVHVMLSAGFELLNVFFVFNTFI